VTTPGTELPWQLVDARIRMDPARPLLTYYADPLTAAGDPDPNLADRIDLTGATWATWVAKTANLLVDDLGLAVDADPAPVVWAALPPHWQTGVWADAANRVGAEFVANTPGDEATTTAPNAAADPPAVAVALPAGVAAALATGAADVLVAPLLPMNAPSPVPLPGGVLDYAAEVAAHGDRFAPPARAPRPSDEALIAAAAALVDVAGLRSGDRVLSTGTVPGSPYVELLAVAAVDGSLVLSPDAGALSPADRADRWAAERITAAVPADRDLLG